MVYGINYHFQRKMARIYLQKTYLLVSVKSDVAQFSLRNRIFFFFFFFCNSQFISSLVPVLLTRKLIRELAFCTCNEVYLILIIESVDSEIFLS